MVLNFKIQSHARALTVPPGSVSSLELAALTKSFRSGQGWTTCSPNSDSWPVSSSRSSLVDDISVLEGEVTLSSDYVALVTGDKRGGRRRCVVVRLGGGAASLPVPLHACEMHLHRGRR